MIKLIGVGLLVLAVIFIIGGVSMGKASGARTGAYVFLGILATCLFAYCFLYSDIGLNVVRHILSALKQLETNFHSDYAGI